MVLARRLSAKQSLMPDGRTKNGGAGRGQGRTVKPPAKTTTAELIAALHKRLDAKPPQVIPQAMGRQLLALLEASCPWCGGFGYDAVQCRACGWLERQPTDETPIIL